jgi:hypothetical protein
LSEVSRETLPRLEEEPQLVLYAAAFGRVDRLVGLGTRRAGVRVL